MPGELPAELTAELGDADPGELLRAAESRGQPLGDRVPPVEPPGLPVRLDVVPPAPEERRAAIERQLAWAHAGGASWDGIAFRVDAGGDVSVRARRPLPAGAPILIVPRRLMMVDNELASTTAEALDRPSDTLAAWLALEARAPTSRWRPYLDALPVRLDELPLFHADLGALAGTAAHALALEQRRDVHAAYHRMPTALRARLSLADFAWGCGLVTSRAYHAPGTFEHRVAMIPLVELLNHGLGDTTWSYDPREGFVVRTERPIAVDDEVQFPYGVRSNTHLAVHFGFALPDNSANEAGLVFELDDPIHAAAADLLWNQPLGAPVRIRVGGVMDDRFQRMLSIARLAVSRPADRARAVELGLTPYGDLPWLDAALEDAALDAIAAAARRARDELETHDASASGRWHQLCALVRDGERAVVTQLLDFTRLARLDPAQLPDDATGALVRQYRDAIAP